MGSYRDHRLCDVTSPSVHSESEHLSWIVEKPQRVCFWFHYLVTVFTARCYASAVLAMALCLSVRLSVHPSVCPSVTSRCSTKTAKRRITQTTPHDSPGSLVFWAKDICEIRPGSPPAGAPNTDGAGSRRYTGDIHNSIVVGLFMTPIRQWKRLGRVMVECTCLFHVASN